MSEPVRRLTREAFDRGRRDVRRLGRRPDELRQARYLARVSALPYDRAYWLGVVWEETRP